MCFSSQGTVCHDAIIFPRQQRFFQHLLDILYPFTLSAITFITIHLIMKAWDFSVFLVLHCFLPVQFIVQHFQRKVMHPSNGPRCDLSKPHLILSSATTAKKHGVWVDVAAARINETTSTTLRQHLHVRTHTQCAHGPTQTKGLTWHSSVQHFVPSSAMPVFLLPQMWSNSAVLLLLQRGIFSWTLHTCATASPTKSIWSKKLVPDSRVWAMMTTLAANLLGISHVIPESTTTCGNFVSLWGSVWKLQRKFSSWLESSIQMGLIASLIASIVLLEAMCFPFAFQVQHLWQFCEKFLDERIISSFE